MAPARPRVRNDPYVTQPAMATTDAASGLRVYSIDGQRLPSVTSVIGLARAEPLERWKRLQVARLAARRHDLLAMRVQQYGVDGAARKVVDAVDHAPSEAAQIGDEVHGWLEARAKGEEPPVVSEAAQPWLAGAQEFLAHFEPRFVAVEATAVNRQVGYAGTADFIAYLGDALVIGDYKTGSAVHGEVAMQLGALARCEAIVTPDGTERPMPQVVRAVVVHVNPALAGGYCVRPVELGEEPWRRFRACLALWETRQVSAWVGDAIDSPAGLGAFAITVS